MIRIIAMLQCVQLVIKNECRCNQQKRTRRVTAVALVSGSVKAQLTRPL